MEPIEEPPMLPDAIQALYEDVLTAAGSGDLHVLECAGEDGKPVYALCVVYPDPTNPDDSLAVPVGTIEEGIGARLAPPEGVEVEVRDSDTLLPSLCDDCKAEDEAEHRPGVARA